MNCMSQQVMTIVSLVSGVKGRKLSDLEFLSIKEFNDKRVDVDGEVADLGTSETDVATQTANTGKDMYLGKAVITLQQSSTTVTNLVKVRLFANAVEIEKRTVEVQSNSGSKNSEGFYEFISKGVKVETGQIIKITAEPTSATGTLVANATLTLWEEDTGVSPQIPST